MQHIFQNIDVNWNNNLIVLMLLVTQLLPFNLSVFVEDIIYPKNM